MKINKKLIITIGTIVLFLGLTTGGYFYLRNDRLPNTVQSGPNDKYVAFLLEVYDKINENYWQKPEENNLITLYEKGVEKITDQPQQWNCQDKQCVEKKLEEKMNGISSEKAKKEFAQQLADIVLANLQPFGRSRLYVQKDEIALQKRVTNQTDKDYYQELEVDKEASVEKINQKAEEKIAQLMPQATESPEVQEKINKIKEAQQVLGDEKAKENYDTAGIAPTIEYELIQPEILHLHLTKFSPTTLEDLQRITEKFDQGEKLDTLIIDLRDNVGGAIDGLPYFLGPFIGNNQYAYQYYHQGENEDHKTKLGWLPSLVRYKKVVVLINENAQSSAEVFASVLKKYNVGILVGKTTKGWGTVERVFPIENQIAENEKYSMFLVHRLTLRADGQPIQSKGVEPHIDITKEDWQDKLYDYIPYPDLITAVNQIWNN
jgi:C-terminal processing protease CtpA/Prc